MQASQDALLSGVGGTRLSWEQVPETIRTAIEDRLGGAVVGAVSQERGFSPALAARLRLSDGRRVFVKAIGPDEESGAPGGRDLYRREAEITAQLPATVPAPRLLASWESDGWVVLVLEDVEGRNPALPWRRDELQRVLDGVTELAGALTPSPLALPPARLPGEGPHWPQLAANPSELNRIIAPDPWLHGKFDDLVRAEASFADAVAGGSMLHCDIRADNVLLTPERVLFVDWPHACVGAPWLDLLYLLPSVAMQGGPDPDELFWAHPLGRDADRTAVVAGVAGFAGFMLHGATQPGPPGLPKLPRFQLAHGVVALRWLRQLMTGG